MQRATTLARGHGRSDQVPLLASHLVRSGSIGPVPVKSTQYAGPEASRTAQLPRE
jgi:hypothetical protein